MVNKILIDETMKRIARKDWDFYRDNYINGKYTYEDLIAFNNIIFEIFHEQAFFHIGWARKFLNRFSENISVVEFGCNKGQMAAVLLKEHKNILSWLGCDISNKALLNSEVDSSLPFVPMFLSKPFWSYNLSEFSYDVFISTHTLEHLRWTEVELILAKANLICEKGIYLEMPIPENGKVWRKGGSSHVLTKGRKHFREWFKQRGWKIFLEKEKGINWAIGARR